MKVYNCRNQFGFLLYLFCTQLLLGCTSLLAQTQWPLVLENSTMKITIYKPEVETSDQSTLSFRSAISINQPKNAEPVFASMWVDTRISKNNSQQTATINSAKVNEIRFPDGVNFSNESDISLFVDQQLNAKKPVLLFSDLASATSANAQLESGSEFPLILYSNKPAVLVNIDGDPILEATESKGIEMVTNTPFLILKSGGTFYLSNGMLWYQTTNLKSKPWTPLKKAPNNIQTLATKLMDKTDDAFDEFDKNGYLEVMTTYEPTELIQTDGSPSFKPVGSTNLLYVENSNDQILLDIQSQMYYTLLSGRWFSSRKLESGWKYVAANQLPADFASIPEGNVKDVVLASVPGTLAAKNAVRDAQIPQTAQVDRNTASTSVTYDGDPIFEPISGTDLYYAANSSNTVLMEHNNYYIVDNGVWFVGASRNGPWRVSDRRPVQVVNIPPACPVYNVRYVEIYETTPQYVYVGYTNGYLSSYVMHNTVVYGTAYHYRPWRGRHYYPRPCTWGYGMSYNPWNGWSVNFNYGMGSPHGWLAYQRPVHHGWWGPPVYRPPYCVPYTHYYGTRRAQVQPRYANNSRYSSGRNDRYNTRNVYQTSSRVNNTRGSIRPTNTQSFTRDETRANSRNTYTSYGSNARPDNSRPSSSRPSTSQPSSRPSTSQPSSRPSTSQPSSRPSTSQPSSRPSTSQPSSRPSTSQPSSRPSTSQPSSRPSTSQPSSRPSTSQPSSRPSTSQPSSRPSTSQPSSRPSTSQPSSRPSTSQPSSRPSTSQPSSRPSTSQPSARPSTSQPSARPSTSQPSARPSTSQPSSRPSTSQPSSRPSTSSRTSEPSRSSR